MFLILLLSTTSTHPLQFQRWDSQKMHLFFDINCIYLSLSTIMCIFIYLLIILSMFCCVPNEKCGTLHLSVPDYLNPHLMAVAIAMAQSECDGAVCQNLVHSFCF